MVVKESKDGKYSVVRDAQWNYYVYCGRDLFRTPGNKPIASEYKGIFESMIDHYDETGDMGKVNEYLWHVELFDNSELFGDRNNTVRRIMMNWDEKEDVAAEEICEGCSRSNIKEWLSNATAMQLVAISETMERLSSLKACYCIADIVEKNDEDDRDFSPVEGLFETDIKQYIKDFVDFYRYDFEEYGESIPDA